ncbi:MupA/Atu3671 family FMN-dependent luciferase-like monooxygenase [Pyxidicoccus xibeiensis]|uniref:MupA/Atu3671 family FMN-dependent luciferase-like monooxygenase n=1 Tax=Pyxidicoccus xibeiensis TaxID=2906759 RepID=UPI0020A8050D|nr:MupA/Atu3671 family FMN-dependent luciferase-like monooxygenase [Pyxidicoccus xibeiensis]MCP3142307.1 LLM class flavin-dependent oxidoreductase [Pyxidicoccus xibeiensis]
MKNVQDVYRLSPVQRELLSRLEAPEARPSCLHWSFRQGLDETALESALRQLLARHTVLRTGFFWQGMPEPKQVVREQVEPKLERLDLSKLAEAERPARLAAFLAQERRRAMNPSAAPLLRVTVLRTSPEAGTVVLCWHPLILDDASALRCVQELFLLYGSALEGEAPGLGSSRPYRDYVAWLERRDAVQPVRAPLTEARGPELPRAWQPSSREGAGDERLVQRFLLEPAVTGQVQAFLRQHSVDLGTLLQAAWAVLLHQQGQGDDLVFGVLTGCPAPLASDGALLGRFATLAPRRIQVARTGSRLTWLRGLQAGLADARLDEPASSPVHVGSVLTTDSEDALLKPSARRLGFHGLSLLPSWLPAPLVISATQGPRLALRFQYDAGRLDSTVVARLAGHLGTLVEALALHPERELSVLPGASWAATSLTVGNTFGPREVEAVLAQHPSVASVTVAPDSSAPGSGRLVARVVPARPVAEARRGKPGFSLFFFANEDARASNKYRLYLDSARLADRNGFTAVWTPERHFDEHGGLYPNPSVLTAALATITERIGLRAGSVVLPLHHPLRVAEDWSTIDNLSNGRAGIAVTSGWMPQDFALAPDHFAQKRDVLFQSLAKVRELWRGGTVPCPDGTGREVPLRTFPRPIQPELPVWLTCPGNPELFEKAGELGVNVLTSLASQSVEEVREKLALYRAARARAGHDPATGIATVMLHTYVGRDADAVLDLVREPLTHYLRTHLKLQEARVRALDLNVDINDPKWLDSLARFAFELHYRTSALIGTPTSCLPMVERLTEAGADELACFIDFGVEGSAVLEGLAHLVELKALVDDDALRMRRVLAAYVDERLPGLPPLSIET